MHYRVPADEAEVTPGGILRAARERSGVSQASLAARAGTTQSAISRIESDRISPTFATLQSLMALLGERLELRSERVEFGIDRGLLNANLDLSPDVRLSRGIAFGSLITRNRGIARG